jgi:hypothetical protein
MARLLIEERKRAPFHGSVLQLGRQAILFSEAELKGWLKSDGSASSRNGHAGPRTSMSDEEFFSNLGFEHVSSCDASPYEKASMTLNLNVAVPDSLHGKFDVVYDGGTMEHIFNVPGVLRNIHDLLAAGGRAIHVVPSSNMVDHGFYSFSPTLFADYYRANGYALRTLYLFECNSWRGPWKVYDCLAGGINNQLGRVSTTKMSGVFCVAEKTAESTADVCPEQGHFAVLWQQSAPPEAQSPGLAKRARSFIASRFPRLEEALLFTRAVVWRTPVARRSALPPFVGRY